MKTADQPAPAAQAKPAVPLCRDLDDECPDVACKTSCWLYDPGRGMCPFLRAAPKV